MTIFAAMALAVLPACGQQKAQPPPQNKPAAAESPPVKPLSQAECEEYAQAVVKAVASGDEAGFNALIDWNSLFATATANLEAPEKLISEIIQGMRKSLVTGGALARPIMQSTKLGGSFDVLRIRDKGGQPAAVFRMVGPENQGVSYFEFTPKRCSDQKVRAVNVYPYASGELFTESIRRMILPFVAAESRSFLEKLVTKEQDFVHDLPKLQPIAEAVQQRRAKDALRLINELRPETKKQKFVLLIRIQAAQIGDDEKEYVAVLEDFRKLFPNDPCLDLLSIDYYSLKQDFAQVTKCMERLDASVGGDPFLSYLQAMMAAQRGERAQAWRLATEAIKKQPPFKKAFFYVVDLSLEDKKYDETLAGLKRLHETFGTTFKNLTTVPAYAGFVKSPQYQEWLKYLAKTAQAQTAKQGRKTAPGAEKQPTARTK